MPRTRTGPGFGTCVRPAITGFVPSQTQTVCSYNFRARVLNSTCAKISTFAQTRESNLVLVRRLERRTFAHTN